MEMFTQTTPCVETTTMTCPSCKTNTILIEKADEGKEFFCFSCVCHQKVKKEGFAIVLHKKEFYTKAGHWEEAWFIKYKRPVTGDTPQFYAYAN